MPNFKRIGGGLWKYGQKSDDLTWNDPNATMGGGVEWEVGEVHHSCTVPVWTCGIERTDSFYFLVSPPKDTGKAG